LLVYVAYVCLILIDLMDTHCIMRLQGGLGVEYEGSGSVTRWRDSKDSFHFLSLSSELGGGLDLPREALIQQLREIQDHEDLEQTDGENDIEFMHRQYVIAGIASWVSGPLSARIRRPSALFQNRRHSDLKGGHAMKEFDAVAFPYPLILDPETSVEYLNKLEAPMTAFFALKPAVLLHGDKPLGQVFFGFAAANSGKGSDIRGGEFRFHNGYPTFAALGTIFGIPKDQQLPLYAYEGVPETDNPNYVLLGYRFEASGELSISVNGGQWLQAVSLETGTPFGEYTLQFAAAHPALTVRRSDMKTDINVFTTVASGNRHDLQLSIGGSGGGSSGASFVGEIAEVFI
jgi:hypothetical protein